MDGAEWQKSSGPIDVLSDPETLGDSREADSASARNDVTRGVDAACRLGE